MANDHELSFPLVKGHISKFILAMASMTSYKTNIGDSNSYCLNRKKVKSIQSTSLYKDALYCSSRVLGSR